MTGYQLVEVKDAATRKAFLELPHRIYANDNAWVCPLDEEIEGVFNPAKNPFFHHGEAIRWILKDAKGEVRGRIAAFYNEKKAKSFEVPTGGCGFFECIQDEGAAFTLFDAAQAWLKAKGMQAMDGPVNFGENDAFWGLLVEGFTHPSFGMNYHPPYYKAFFENYGFEVFFEQVSKHLDAVKPMPERFAKIYEWVKAKPGIQLRHAEMSKLPQYGNDLMTVYNDAWQFHEHFTPMRVEDVNRLISRMKHIIIPEFLIFAYVDGEPAGFVLALPDINQVFKPLKGKFPLWQKLLFKWRSRNSFAWYRKHGHLDRLRVMVIGVRPKFQKFGIESAVTIHNFDTCRAMGFKEIELSWVGDFNPSSRKLQDATEAKLGKVHRTYRFMFDRSQSAGRLSTLSTDTRTKS
jgi:hypothetical protein